MIKYSKILIGIIVIMIGLSFPLKAYAKMTLDDILKGGNEFLKADEGTTLPVDQSGIKSLSNTVSGILLSIAIIVTLVSAVVMGINFTVQSVEDKAQIKESMIPWVIGIIISFGAFSIWKITMSIFYNV